MTDKQRLLATGLFIERGPNLLLEEDSTLACEIVVRVTTQLRFDSIARTRST